METESQKHRGWRLTVRCQNDLTLSGEEGVALALAFELRRKRLCRDLLAGDMALRTGARLMGLLLRDLLLWNLIFLRHLAIV